MTFDIAGIRRQITSQVVTDDGRRRIYFDNPGGTQVPQRVIDRMTAYLSHDNANVGGPFVTSRRTDALMARVTMVS